VYKRERERERERDRERENILPGAAEGFSGTARPSSIWGL